MFICEKEELYTFSELSYIRDQILSDSDAIDFQDSLVLKIENLQSCLVSDKEKMAIFFMPEQSFKVFATFQGNKPAAEIDETDIQKMISSVSKAEETQLRTHTLSKLNTLCKFISEGNKVFPVPTPADNFKRI